MEPSLRGDKLDWKFFDRDGIKALNAILQQHPSLKFTQIGDSLFDMSTRQDIGNGVEIVWFLRKGNKLQISSHLARPSRRKKCELLGKQQLPPSLSQHDIRKLTAQYQKKVFRHTANKEVSLRDYFQTKYGITLKYMYLAEASNGDKQLPIECYEIVEGQRYWGNLNATQQTYQTIPGESIKLIDDAMKSKLAVKMDPVLKQFRLEVGQEMERVGAVVKEIPKVHYNGNSKHSSPRINEDRAKWQLTGVKLYQSGSTVESVHHAISKYVKLLEGTTVRPQVVLFIVDDDRGERKHMNKPQYDAVKQVLETIAGILSQCVRAPYIFNPKNMRGYCLNVSLKLNLKLDGTNSVISIPQLQEDSFLVLGADITHPTLGVKKFRPLQLSVLSIDTPSDIRKSTRHSIKKGVEDIVRKLPDRIVVYRDGIPGTLFQSVALDQSCLVSEMHALTWIVFISHRLPILLSANDIRFYWDDKKSNVPPGTIADSTITHPFLYDFFLQSSSTSFGTCRKPHYHVLLGENKFNVNELHDFKAVLQLPQAVSIPAPVYYV
ncbi:2341_t:CDS:2 [Paraglomus occultum]|uniref:2341_t:CDS:1 n=1 Tax=Paraglomus occultum TaxID=144539 RepID=A0A9N8ZZP4_9GLOM|nr:2341_t:CDS:2 [Paraglomus occultum]